MNIDYKKYMKEAVARRKRIAARAENWQANPCDDISYSSTTYELSSVYTELAAFALDILDLDIHDLEKLPKEEAIKLIKEKIKEKKVKNLIDELEKE